MKHVRIGLAALVTVAAAAGACATVWLAVNAIAGPAAATQPAVLATVVALSLARRDLAGRREFVRSAAALPLVGMAAAGVGWLLVDVPPLGAVLFIAGMSVPIWLRRFGPLGARVGALIALPLTAMLVVPAAPEAPGTPWWPAALLAAGAGAVATLWVTAARELLMRPWLGRSQHGTAHPPRATRPTSRPSEARSGPPSRRLPASTRMAVQMATALAAAFVTGWLLFPSHAMWIVLTAYIVNAGNRGRGDVLHKSGLRVTGAVGGTVIALLLLSLPTLDVRTTTLLVFVTLFAGTWLRAYSYAYWALAVTIILTLLQHVAGAGPAAGEAGLLAERVAAIVVGALLGIGAAWFVLPVRSSDVLRRRLSDLLAALAALVGADRSAHDAEEDEAAFRSALRRVEELAPAHRARRRLGAKGIQPIDCVEAACGLGPAVAERVEETDDDERVDLAIRRARASLRPPFDADEVHRRLVGLAAALRGGTVA
ncbi:hypothetical protein IT072_02770 [Leifsonia sp. ZF2019]|uniref:FUSC family protein n=1 Tax=Leifsonia sp. ZF2019 TaxID=2781978 RepID=UPI001CBB2033|nr:FUSC family protein [Leifsonia sp. ZF2019]UAJ80018.1 hypothetical protein IT072_02770 [Leifsonia sp. ZF2019]